MVDLPLILIAEDDADARNMISRFLERRGFKTVCAQDGVEAIKIIKHRQPKLIILDIMLPKVNGVDIIKNLRENVPEQKWQPLIVTTGLPSFYEQKYLRKDLDIYINKPCLMSEILNAVLQIQRTTAFSAPPPSS